MDKSSLAYILTSYHKDEMIEELTKHQLFDEVFKLAIASDTLSPRAAYMPSHLCKKNDSRLSNSFDAIVNAVHDKPDGQQRDLLRTLQQLDLNEDQIGEAYDLCSKLWMETLKIPSVRYIAFLFMIEIAKQHPELKEDLKLMSDELYMESLSPGIKRSLTAKLNKLK